MIGQLAEPANSSKDFTRKDVLGSKAEGLPGNTSFSRDRYEKFKS